METLKEIVSGTTAKLNYIYNSKICYQIETKNHLYQLELNMEDDDWKNAYIYPEFKAITLMRWIRKGIEKNDDTFIMLK